MRKVRNDFADTPVPSDLYFRPTDDLEPALDASPPRPAEVSSTNDFSAQGPVRTIASNLRTQAFTAAERKPDPSYNTVPSTKTTPDISMSLVSVAVAATPVPVSRAGLSGAQNAALAMMLNAADTGGFVPNSKQGPTPKGVGQNLRSEAIAVPPEGLPFSDTSTRPGNPSTDVPVPTTGTPSGASSHASQSISAATAPISATAPVAAATTLAAAPPVSPPADYNSVYGEALNLWVPSEEGSPDTIQIMGLPTNGTVVLSDGTTRVAVGQQLTPAQAAGLRFKPNGVAQSSHFDYKLTAPGGLTASRSEALAIDPLTGTVTTPTTGPIVAPLRRLHPRRLPRQPSRPWRSLPTRTRSCLRTRKPERRRASGRSRRAQIPRTSRASRPASARHSAGRSSSRSTTRRATGPIRSRSIVSATTAATGPHSSPR